MAAPVPPIVVSFPAGHLPIDDFALHRLCENGTIKEVQDFLRSHPGNINNRDANGNTPLHIACQNNRVDLVPILLEADANPNLPNGDGDAPLHIACENLDPDVGLRVALVGALLNTRDARIDINIRNSIGNTPLIAACMYGNGGIVRSLLNARANINAQDPVGCSALCIALENGYIKIAEILLNRGADPNIGPDPDTQIYNEFPLYHAYQIYLEDHNPELIQLLVNEGANINRRYYDDGYTLLHLALRKGQEDLVGQLLELGADPEIADDKGTAPINYANREDPRSYEDFKESLIRSHSNFKQMTGLSRDLADEVASYGSVRRPKYTKGERSAKEEKE